MKSRIKFVSSPKFNYPPNRIAWPAVVVGASIEHMHTLCFTAHEKIDELTYEGDACWLVEHAEKELTLAPGTRFRYIANPVNKTVLAEGTVLCPQQL